WRAIAAKKVAARVEWSGDRDPVVRDAATLLRQHGVAADPRRVAIHTRHTDPAFEVAAGRWREADQVVGLAADHAGYELALAGDPRLLAAIWLHELRHVDGDGEAEAFAAERRFLIAVGAPQRWIDAIDAMAAECAAEAARR